MADALWYYEDSGKPAGPVTAAALLELLRLGQLPAGARVWRSGLATWQAWEKVPELAQARAAAAPPPPPAWSAPAAGWPPPGPGAPQPAPEVAPPAGPQAAPQAGPAPTTLAPQGRPQPQPWAAPGAPPLVRTEVATVVLLSIVTLSIYGVVKFYQVGKGYERLTPGRPSRFDTLFWTWLGLQIAALAFSLASPPFGFLLTIGGIVAGAFLLTEVLAARTALVGARGLRLELTSPDTHRILWILGEVLSIVLVGVVLLIIQAVKFFGDHDRVAVALAGGPGTAFAPAQAGAAPHQGWSAQPTRPGPAQGWGPPAAPAPDAPPAAASRPLPGRFCAACGAPMAPEARFCGGCGKAI